MESQNQTTEGSHSGASPGSVVASPDLRPPSAAGEAIVRRIRDRIGAAPGVIPLGGIHHIADHIGRMVDVRLPLLDAVQRRWNVSWQGYEDGPELTYAAHGTPGSDGTTASASPWAGAQPDADGHAVPVVSAARVSAAPVPATRVSAAPVLAARVSAAPVPATRSLVSVATAQSIGSTPSLAAAGSAEQGEGSGAVQRQTDGGGDAQPGSSGEMVQTDQSIPSDTPAALPGVHAPIHSSAVQSTHAWSDGADRAVPDMPALGEAGIVVQRHTADLPTELPRVQASKANLPATPESGGVVTSQQSTARPDGGGTNTGRPSPGAPIRGSAATDREPLPQAVPGAARAIQRTASSGESYRAVQTVFGPAITQRSPSARRSATASGSSTSAPPGDVIRRSYDRSDQLGSVRPVDAEPAPLRTGGASNARVQDVSVTETAAVQTARIASSTAGPEAEPIVARPLNAHAPTSLGPSSNAAPAESVHARPQMDPTVYGQEMRARLGADDSVPERVKRVRRDVDQTVPSRVSRAQRGPGETTLAGMDMGPRLVPAVRSQHEPGGLGAMPVAAPTGTELERIVVRAVSAPATRAERPLASAIPAVAVVGPRSPVSQRSLSLQRSQSHAQVGAGLPLAPAGSDQASVLAAGNAIQRRSDGGAAGTSSSDIATAPTPPVASSDSPSAQSLRMGDMEIERVARVVYDIIEQRLRYERESRAV